MNKEKQLKPMTKEEEYRNADVPMPEDEFKKQKKQQTMNKTTKVAAHIEHF